MDPKAQIEVMVTAALRQAQAQPHLQSAIFGQTALGFSAMSQRPEFTRQAPMLRALAEHFAVHALQDQPDVAALDDFAELLEERNAAHQQFKGDMDVKARAKQLHDQRLEDGGAARRVSIAPISWGKNATLGRTGTFAYNPTNDQISIGIGQSGTLALWQGESHEAQSITIDLAPPANFAPKVLTALPNPSLTPELDSRTYGNVFFGSDGAITEVKFDAGFGARFTVTGNYVAIIAGVDAPFPGASSGTMSFTASIGAFASPSVAPVFLTQYIDRLPSGDTTVPFARPLHATHVLPILSDSLGGNAILKFWNQSATRIVCQFSYPIGQLTLPIPIPSAVQYITLTNSTGGQANFRIPYQLSL